MEIGKECMACKKGTKIEPIMLCYQCGASFHRDCVHFRFTKSNTLEMSWTCSNCSKIMKGVSKFDQPQTGTKRRKASNTTDSSSSSVSTIRDTIREEIKNLFDLQIHPQLMEVQNAVSSLETTMAYCKKKLVKIDDFQDKRGMKNNFPSLNEFLIAKSISLKLSQIEHQLRTTENKIQRISEDNQKILLSL